MKRIFLREVTKIRLSFNRCVFCFFVIIIFLVVTLAPVFAAVPEYICIENDGSGLSGQGGGANRAPCWGDDSSVPPYPPSGNSNSISLSTSTTVDCDLSHASDATYQIGNDCWVRHYARISKSNPPTEIRFYYTVGTSTSTVSVRTNVDDPANDNHFLKGTLYRFDATYNYYYADIPSDIHSAGYRWDANNPTGVIGVRISGKSNTTPWQNESSGQTYTYYVRKTPGYKAVYYPGEKENNVRPYPLKHVQKFDGSPGPTVGTISRLLTNSPPSSLCYIMPGGNPPVDKGQIGSGGYTEVDISPPIVTDDKPDIFYGERPDLYLRLAYGDGDSTDNTYARVIFQVNTNGVWFTDNTMDLVSTTTISGIDYDARDDTVAWGLGSTEYDFPPGSSTTFSGHFSFMKTPNITKLANDISSIAPPERAIVDYYFKIKDGTDTKFRFNKDIAGSPGVSSNEVTARTYTYWYPVLQDDYSRPYVQYTAGDNNNGLQPQNVIDSGNCPWTIPYTVRADLWDLNDAAYAPSTATASDTYANVVSGRGANSGIYHNPDANATGETNCPVHDTRVYYKIAAISPIGIGANRYLSPSTTPDHKYIQDDAAEGEPDVSGTVYDVNDNNNDGCGYAQMTGSAGGGQWLGQIPLRESDTDKYIYYRIYVCNDDHNPQSFNYTSNNSMGFIMPVVGRVDSSNTYNYHYSPTDWGEAFSNPYDLTAGGACDTDRDHGWATLTRYGGKIVAQKMIKMKSKTTVGGVTKEVTAYINAEGSRLGNVIYMNTEKGE